jgi:polyhydroxybutyrate depolymerase
VVDISGRLPVGGLERTFTVRLPDGVPPGGLAIVLHGNHSSASGRVMREGTSFDRQSEEWGLAVAYPDGYGGCWADGRGVTSADESGVDDVAFLRALIDWTAARRGTPTDRTLVAGISNGAFMAHRMGTGCGDQVAVIAAVAGGLPARLSTVEPRYAVSAMLIHGTADTVASIEGGFSRHRGPDGELRGRMLSLAQSAARWRTVDRCPEGPGVSRTTEFSRRTTWSGGTGGTAVVAWTVFAHGHAWPGTRPAFEGAPPSSTEFDAAEEICRFAMPLLLPAGTRRR